MVKRKKLPAKEVDEQEIASDHENSDQERSASEDDFFETPDEKRVRLAKEYLQKFDGKTEVQEQLVQDLDEKEGRSRFQVADFTYGEPHFHRGHKFAATCSWLTEDDRTLFTGSKDCAILRWDVETGSKDVFHAGGRNRFECGGHFQSVLGVCGMESRQMVITAGADRLLRFWDPRTSGTACFAKLHGHQGAITSVVADLDGKHVYTTSTDKTMRQWDVVARRQTSTLLGHMSGATSLDMASKGRPVTGGEDKTVRVWNIERDTHLIFNKHTYSVDAVAALDHQKFVSGSQDGVINVWSSTSKKPLGTASIGNHWVSALSAMKRSNMFFSGSTDCFLRSWCLVDNKVELALPPLKAPGRINSISVGRRILACAVGKEHKFGRWFYEQPLRNGVFFVPISYGEN
uniref:Uncharacterized protein n=1 Tax=Noctiluca scintillans TaxID=2966 RepID=A0A7S1AIN4_NOCSC|mmetsp:Transcript_47927/g.126896  ORF Transcript_47927/g.126896 Transcript_47927/m.126896 type:complete len:403 (+) Transcript_47927:98-1306(+)